MRHGAECREPDNLVAAASLHRERKDRRDIARPEGDSRHQELRDSIPRIDLERVIAVGVQEQHPDLSPVPRVDQPRRVDQPDPVLRRQSRARQHQPRVAGRNLDRDPGADVGPLPRPDGGGLHRVQVEARVTTVGATGKPGTFPKQPYGELHGA